MKNIICTIIVVLFSFTQAQGQEKIDLLDLKENKDSLVFDGGIAYNGTLGYAFKDSKFDVDTIGYYEKEKRYFDFTQDLEYNRGVLIFDEEIGKAIYCDKFMLVVFDTNLNKATFVKKRRCGYFRVSSYANCGFLPISYNTKDKTLYYTEKNVVLKDKNRCFSLKLDKILK